MPMSKLNDLMSVFAFFALSINHRSLVAEKYGSITKPVLLRTSRLSPGCAFKRSHKALVRRHCQTIALQIGRPVALFQATTVSPWLSRPTATICFARHRAFRIADRVARRIDRHCSTGSCSTQPGLGYDLLTPTEPNPRSRPVSSKSADFVRVVPWSIARTYFFTVRILRTPVDVLSR